MTHQYEHPAASAPGPGRSWRRLAPAAAAAVVLAGAGTVSLIHLADAWREGAPYRARRAVEAEARRAERAAGPAESGRLVDTGAARDMGGPPVVTGARPAAPQRPRRDSAPVEQAVRWRVAPVYTVRARDLAPGVTRASVRFSCTVRRDGTLTACTARETPPGSGLAAATLPALANARMEPMLIDGRAVESVATLGVSYELSSAPPRPTPADAAAPAGPVELPAAEPAPAPDPVPVDPAPPGPPAG